MSNTKRHKIEGLYHNGIIPLKDVPREVQNGWNRHAYKGATYKTAGAEKLNRIRQEQEISDINDINKEIV